MTRGRALTIAITLQLLSVLALTQSWFQISMAPSGNTVQLGAYDGSTTYPAAMPLHLLGLAATMFATLTVRFARLLVLAIASLVSLLSLAFVGVSALSKQISALDGALDRLTGIANTHGISELSVETTFWFAVWIVCEFVVTFWLILTIIWQSKWQTTAIADASGKQTKSAKSRNASSTIELWDQQRD